MIARENPMLFFQKKEIFFVVIAIACSPSVEHHCLTKTAIFGHSMTHPPHNDAGIIDNANDLTLYQGPTYPSKFSPITAFIQVAIPSKSKINAKSRLADRPRLLVDLSRINFRSISANSEHFIVQNNSVSRLL